MIVTSVICSLHTTNGDYLVLVKAVDSLDNPQKEEYVTCYTWHVDLPTLQVKGWCQGHYFRSIKSAYADFTNRCDTEINRLAESF